MITKRTKQIPIIILVIAIIFQNCTKTGNNAEPIQTKKDNYTLDIKIKGAINKTFYLYQYFGDKTYIVDTVLTDKTGSFKTDLNSNYKPGLYKLEIGNKNYFNFIINDENVQLNTFIVNAMDSMQIIQSVENKILYEYYKEFNSLNRKMNLLGPIVHNYPKSSEFYETALNEFNQIQEKYLNDIETLVNTEPNSFAAKYIKFLGFNKIDPVVSEKKQKQYLIDHYFENTDFCDSSLLNSNAIPQKIVSYLSLFGNQKQSQNQLEESYKLAVDNILNQALCNDQIFEYALNYLIDGFEQLKYEEVLVHLSQNYVPLISCVNENFKNNLEDKISKYEKVSVGKTAPDFEIKTTENKLVSLYNIDSDYTLILFWASWCPHCTKTLSEVQKIYNTETRSKLEIIAISLDSKKEDWKNFLNNKNYNWINCSELKGWDSKVAIDYNIYATPTMILLDKDKNIIAKPRTVTELKEFI